MIIAGDNQGIIAGDNQGIIADNELKFIINDNELNISLLNNHKFKQLPSYYLTENGIDIIHFYECKLDLITLTESVKGFEIRKDGETLIYTENTDRLIINIDKYSHIDYFDINGTVFGILNDEISRLKNNCPVYIDNTYISDPVDIHGLVDMHVFKRLKRLKV